MSAPPFDPADLRPRAAAAAAAARASGALETIETETEWIADGGVRFLVRVVTGLAARDRERKVRAAAPSGGAPARNPFAPYEPAMHVADLSATHVCLLNKFNVVPGHVLLVTREFEEQESPLTGADFEAAALCLAGVDGLVFYNSGRGAGASQPHKHLQAVPLPLAGEGGPPVPVETALGAARFRGAVGDAPGLPFVHALARLEPPPGGTPGAVEMEGAYRSLLAALDIETGGARVTTPYNLLATREWMLAVPRSRERAGSISVNALGYAGSLFVRTRAQVDEIRRRGPLRLLRDTGQPR